jgi:hypothetical protein
VLGVGRIKLALRLIVGLFAYLMYIWFTAVRALPTVRARKAARRARRLS